MSVRFESAAQLRAFCSLQEDHAATGAFVDDIPHGMVRVVLLRGDDVEWRGVITIAGQVRTELDYAL